MYVCMYVYIYTHTYTHTFVYIYIYIYITNARLERAGLNNDALSELDATWAGAMQKVINININNTSTENLHNSIHVT